MKPKVEAKAVDELMFLTKDGETRLEKAKRMAAVARATKTGK